MSGALTSHLRGRLGSAPWAAAALSRAQQVALWQTVPASRGRAHPPASARSVTLTAISDGSSMRPRLGMGNVSFNPPAGPALVGGAQRSGAAVCFAPSGRRHMASNPLDSMDLFGDDAKGTRTVVESYTPEGFIINSTFVEGATILLPEMVLHWNVEGMQDVNWESISLVRLMSKKPEIILLGTGRRIQRVPDALQMQFKRMSVNVEVMDSVNAVATFNVLNQEGRQVVAALLPLESVQEEKNDDEEDFLKDMPRPEMKTRQPGRPQGGSGAGALHGSRPSCRCCDCGAPPGTQGVYPAPQGCGCTRG
mmetsp:Transcript_17131/g.39494  ORF Transcript_17131/g.39494 Transcript_17131/m.39494 type:complete len:308 (+) Transcript_17131:314-1237(+)